MSEFIGSRISLISKSDIRYVGTLVEINSEASTVSLENVLSYGTEGRRGGKEEYAPSSHVYEQIVFRGSDVKDLRIEEPAKENKPSPPAMPDDPAIIGGQQSQSHPDVPQVPQNQGQRPQHPQQAPHQPQNFPPPGQFPPGYPPYGPGFQNQRFGPPGGFPGGPGGFPGPYGMPPGPFGAPPGWYPPPGPGFSQPPGPFSPTMPIGPPGQHNPNQQQSQGPRAEPTAPIGPPVTMTEKPKVAEASAAAQPAEVKSVTRAAPQATPTPPASAVAKQPPPPPVDSKPDVAAALAPPPNQPGNVGPPKAAPTGPKNGRIIPAVPLASPNVAKVVASQAPAARATPAATAPLHAQSAANAASQYQNATQAATAAVAAAMAKLDLAAGKGQQQPKAETPMDNLTRKVNEMRADEQIRNAKQPGTGGYAAGHRGSGRGGRGGRGAHHQQHTKIEVPTTDFDFASANAKFNKQDLVKEAIASGSPLGESAATLDTAATGLTNGSVEKPVEKEVVIPAAAAYNKSTSFFDNISSESRDREEASSRRGMEFRSQERQKNMETFGQGSVDGYRGGYRGRGRGRGFGRGRGGGGSGYRGRGAPRAPSGAQGVPPS
ncbi:hypothetical protein GQ43DRAFT_429053 [Delitschia confertaspora ATCC 74209]|uniref:Uncharacterized protein n=1 Tax=Delitschia confertaspora ATCC 74209 TaxID=1513339 RepID=A0A9P4JVV6_9PLEO|nr:hypothetical protein GQ43DRAFT_429053 [Delitschia confertaspora ATCC 74209]